VLNDSISVLNGLTIYSLKFKSLPLTGLGRWTAVKEYNQPHACQNPLADSFEQVLIELIMSPSALPFSLAINSYFEAIFSQHFDSNESTTWAICFENLLTNIFR
jgi:hypothetical protein